MITNNGLTYVCNIEMLIIRQRTVEMTQLICYLVGKSTSHHTHILQLT